MRNSKIRLLVLASAFVFSGTSIPASAETSDPLVTKVVEQILTAMTALNKVSTNSAVEADLRSARLNKGTGGYDPAPAQRPVDNGTGGYDPYPVYKSPAT